MKLTEDVIESLRRGRQEGAIGAEEQQAYRRTLHAILQQTSDADILNVPDVSGAHKIYTLSLKHGKPAEDLLEQKDDGYWYDGVRLLSFRSDKPRAVIELINEADGVVTIEGHLTGRVLGGRTIVFCVDGQDVGYASAARPKKDKLFFGEVVDTAIQFKVELPYGQPPKTLTCWAVDGDRRSPVAYTQWPTSRLAAHTRAYRVVGEAIVRRPNDESITVARHTGWRRCTSELTYWPSLLGQLKFGPARRTLGAMHSQGVRSVLARRGAKGVVKDMLVPIKSPFVNLVIVFFRLLTFVRRPMKRRQIWLVSDRANMAGDNGEAFFRFLATEQPDGVDVYFVLTKTSSDYERIREHGKVISPDGWRYKMLLPLADNVISSQANDIVFNAFGARRSQMMDLYTYKFVFLQHGIIMGDLSTWLNRFNRDIDLFVTSAHPEYESIVHGDYYYSEKEVRLTGLPRHDLLESRPKKKLIMTPTWRRWLARPLDQATGKRDYNPEFKNSEYYEFYNTLLNNKRLIAALKKAGMTGEFYLHPSLSSQVGDFAANKLFTIMQPPYNYAQAFSEGSILLTDHSSAAFDFTYMRKPLVYAQFDNEEYYRKHQPKGYFDFETDGHGPVTRTVDDTVDALVKIIENDCHVEEKYLRRMEAFFYKFDTQNSRRVYEGIRALDT